MNTDNVKILECNYGLFSMYKQDFENLLKKFYKKAQVQEGSSEQILSLFEDFLRLGNKEWKLYFVIDWNRQELVGYFILFVYLSVFLVKKVLVYQMFILTPHSKDTVGQAVILIEDTAKKLGCKEIEIVTSRKLKGYERWIKKFGAHYKSAVFTEEI